MDMLDESYLSVGVDVEPDGPLGEHGLDDGLILDVVGVVAPPPDVELQLLPEGRLTRVEGLIGESIVGGDEDGIGT